MKSSFLLGLLLAPALQAGAITSSPDFLPAVDIISPLGQEFTVTSSGFAQGWTIRDIRIFNVNLQMTGCQPQDITCVEQDLGAGHFSMRAIINGNLFQESGPMQLITVQHQRTFSGTELIQDVMTIDIGWMRAYPPGGAVPLMLWLNPFGTLVANNIGGGHFDMTLDWTARTMLRTEIPSYEEVLGPLIPLAFDVPEPGGFALTLAAFALGACLTQVRKSLHARMSGIAQG